VDHAADHRAPERADADHRSDRPSGSGTAAPEHTAPVPPHSAPPPHPAPEHAAPQHEAHEGARPEPSHNEHHEEPPH
jgi:hypothetical protein